MDKFNTSIRLREQFLDQIESLDNDLPRKTENVKYNNLRQIVNDNIRLLQISCSPIMIENLIDTIDNQLKTLRKIHLGQEK
jgi:hypothetical protein